MRTALANWSWSPLGAGLIPPSFLPSFLRQYNPESSSAGFTVTSPGAGSLPCAQPCKSLSVSVLSGTAAVRGKPGSEASWQGHPQWSGITGGEHCASTPSPVSPRSAPTRAPSAPVPTERGKTRTAGTRDAVPGAGLWSSRGLRGWQAARSQQCRLVHPVPRNRSLN